jgi:hypothetical protein
VFIINDDRNITFLGHTGPLIIVWALRPLNIVSIHYLKWGVQNLGCYKLGDDVRYKAQGIGIVSF